MKNEVSSIELKHLVAELKTELVGARIDKIYQPSKTVFLFSIRKPGEKKLLRIDLPKYLYLTNAKEEVPARLPGFCAFLRKYLEGKIFANIEQVGAERIVRMDLGQNDGALILFIELFSKGNLIVCEGDKNIIGSLEQAVYKDRVVKPGAFYELPERKPYSDLGLTEFSEKISAGKDNVSTTLAVEMGLGGLFAGEICLLSGVDPKSKANKDQIEKLFVALQNILTIKAAPLLVVKDAKPEEVIVFPMRTYEKFQLAPLKSISEGLDKMFMVAVQKTTPVKDKQLRKTQTIVAMQEKNAYELEEKSEQQQKTGEFIYETYQQVKTILDDLQVLMKHHSLQDIQLKLKGHKIVKDVNPKEGTVTLEF